MTVLVAIISSEGESVTKVLMKERLSWRIDKHLEGAEGEVSIGV